MNSKKETDALIKKYKAGRKVSRLEINILRRVMRPEHDSNLEEAIEEGDRHFYGIPCVHGHDGLRYTNAPNSCAHCARNSTRAWTKENPDYHAEHSREYSKTEKRREYMRGYMKKLRERRAAERAKKAEKAERLKKSNKRK